MAGMGSHDARAERRQWVYICDRCDTAYEDPNDAYDCEDGHQGV